jgi:hypothetical protein
MQGWYDAAVRRLSSPNRQEPGMEVRLLSLLEYIGRLVDVAADSRFHEMITGTGSFSQDYPQNRM